MSKNILRHIPNSITSLNLLTGCVSIVLAFEGHLLTASYLVFLSAIFDFLDGMTARLLNTYSEMGKQLDSLADVISFGLVPAVLTFNIIKGNYQNFNLLEFSFLELLLLFSPFIIAVFSGLRLAKFNIDKRQTSSFIGLPTPANAIFFASLIITSNIYPESFIATIINNRYILIAIIVFFSFMLVAEFPMFSLKFKNLKFTKNKIRYFFIGISVILLISLHTIAIPIIILFYIILSAINNWFIKQY
ncbi:MAG: CDP-diacylglycerol--serine O-phosphatidyltransferase [Bacteroidota bacterium]|nr:CDP-diacylglycerol--serine O-phosphatidyltransferase [Bacteroidota bacterium]